MKPWDDPKTIARFQRMSGAKSAVVAADLTEASLRVLKESIRVQHPRWGPHRCQQELERVLWKIGYGI